MHGLPVVAVLPRREGQAGGMSLATAKQDHQGLPGPFALDPAAGMNGIERRYADELYKLQLAGEILAYEYEPIKLRLAKGTFYTPDFLVVYPDHFEFHEVKGYARDDAMVKVKVAARLYPWFRFVLVRYDKKKGWVKKEVYKRKGKDYRTMRQKKLSLVGYTLEFFTYHLSQNSFVHRLFLFNKVLSESLVNHCLIAVACFLSPCKPGRP
jgi:hypothetical protein